MIVAAVFSKAEIIYVMNLNEIEKICKQYCYNKMVTDYTFL